jgi:hypothetical protein
MQFMPRSELPLQSGLHFGSAKPAEQAHFAFWLGQRIEGATLGAPTEAGAGNFGPPSEDPLLLMELDSAQLEGEFWRDSPCF